VASFAPLPVALSIAGSDCSAGAGLQADLKSFTKFQVYGLTAVTCVVNEVPGKVQSIVPCEASFVADQISLLLRSFPVKAAKTGMLHNAGIIRAVAALWRNMPHKQRPALVVDPVMVATSGDSLVTADAVRAFETELFPLATLLTPNLDEAAVLLGQPITSEADLAPTAATLAKKYGCSILLKGGHLRGKRAVDVLCDKSGKISQFSAAFVPGFATHGTGCTYSAAITANLALGKTLPLACAAAKRFVTRSISQGARWRSQAGTVDALRHW
jgi:hydroxymethylpyrimidine/phosphomethylpyrimidine kinase